MFLVFIVCFRISVGECTSHSSCLGVPIRLYSSLVSVILDSRFMNERSIAQFRDKGSYRLLNLAVKKIWKPILHTSHATVTHVWLFSIAYRSASACLSLVQCLCPSWC